MPSKFKPDPYDGFVADSERRRALNTRVICRTVAAVVVGVAAAPSSTLLAALEHLRGLFAG